MHQEMASLLNQEHFQQLGEKKRATTISVTSGKGGVGKTTLALKLALELEAQNNKVLLIDCDYNLSNTLIKLNIPLDNRFYHFIKSEKSFWETIHKINNLHILPGCSGNIDLFENGVCYDKLIIKIINEYEYFYDYIILDSSAGLDQKTVNLNAYTEYRMIVITPDKSSITDAYSLVKILKMRFGIKNNYILINRYNSEHQLNRVANALIDTAKSYLGCRCQLLGGIREFSQIKENFDDVFFKNKNSLIHHDFVQILDQFYGYQKSMMEMMW